MRRIGGSYRKKVEEKTTNKRDVFDIGEE